MVIPNEGKEIFLMRALTLGDFYSFTDIIIRLFQNNYTPVDASRISDFVQATFTGYLSVTIPHTAWPDVTPVGNVAISQLAVPPVFNCSGGGGQTVYGWYAESGAGGFCLAAQRFDVPRVMIPGSQETLDPFAFRLKTFT